MNAIFCGVSPNEFHKILHITVAKEAWEILETTYEGTKKVKNTKLQMLTTQFEELKMSEDESFDSFYSKLNKVLVSKFNLGEKTEDSKGRSFGHCRKAFVPRWQWLKRARTLMISKSKSWLVLLKPTNCHCPIKERANPLLSRL